MSLFNDKALAVGYFIRSQCLFVLIQFLVQPYQLQPVIPVWRKSLNQVRRYLNSLLVITELVMNCQQHPVPGFIRLSLTSYRLLHVKLRLFVLLELVVDAGKHQIMLTGWGSNPGQPFFKQGNRLLGLSSRGVDLAQSEAGKRCLFVRQHIDRKALFQRLFSIGVAPLLDMNKRYGTQDNRLLQAV